MCYFGSSPWKWSSLAVVALAVISHRILFPCATCDENWYRLEHQTPLPEEIVTHITNVWWTHFKTGRSPNQGRYRIDPDNLSLWKSDLYPRFATMMQTRLRGLTIAKMANTTLTWSSQEICGTFTKVSEPFPVGYRVGLPVCEFFVPVFVDFYLSKPSYPMTRQMLLVSTWTVSLTNRKVWLPPSITEIELKTKPFEEWCNQKECMHPSLVSSVS